MIARSIVLAVACVLGLSLGVGGTSAARERADPAPGVVGVTWALKTMQVAGGQPEQIADSGPTIIFEIGGQVTGSGGCNRFNGTYTAEIGGKLTFSPLASTKIGCAGPIADRETRYFSLLQEVTGYALDGGGATLRLTFAGTGRQLVFAPSTVNQAQVTGTVTYLQRIALPADAVLRVQLLNTSRADAPATVLAEQVGPAGGTASPPYPFSLGYDPVQIVANNTYAVQASIEIGGQLRYRSTRAYLVITQGRPTTDLEITVDPIGSGGSGGTGGAPAAMPQGGGGGMAGRSTETPWGPLALGAALGGVLALGARRRVRRAR
jgi:uncharacterized lipoprotein YbaY/heat shock protein HslJ